MDWTKYDDEIADFPTLPGIDAILTLTAAELGNVSAVTRSVARTQNSEDEEAAREIKHYAQLATKETDDTAMMDDNTRKDPATMSDNTSNSEAPATDNTTARGETTTTHAETQQDANEHLINKAADSDSTTTKAMIITTDDQEHTEEPKIKVKIKVRRCKSLDRQLRQINPVPNPRRETVDIETQQATAAKAWESDDGLSPISRDMIETAQRDCEFCSDLVGYIEKEILPPTARRQRLCVLREFDYTVIDRVLYQIWQPVPSARQHVYLRIVVPQSLQHTLIKTVHCSAIGSHVGIKKMLSIMRTRFQWPGIYNSIEQFVGKCEICQKAKNANNTQHPPRTIYETVDKPWARVHCDFAGKFEESVRGNLYIALVVDAFSGYVIAWPTRNIMTKTFARQFHEKVCCTVGTPHKVVSDNGPQYTSDLWKELGNIMGIKLSRITPYNASSNGRAERFVRSIVELLRCMAEAKPKTWCQHLSSVVFAINNTINNAHGLTPYNLVFGRDAYCGIDKAIMQEDERQTVSETVEEILSQQKYAQQIAIKMHEKRDRELKEIYDSKVKTSTIQAGDVVFWKRGSIPKPGENKKLQNRYEGPYLVVERYPEGTVSLKHLHTAKFLKHRVTLRQVKRANYFRQLDDGPVGLAGHTAENLAQQPVQYAPKVAYKQLQGEE